MLQHEFDSSDGILTLTPHGELTADDFQRVTAVIEEHDAGGHPVNALMICAEHFPGWDSFAALIQHLKFVHRQAERLSKVAVVTESGFLSVMPRVADHFVHAEVRHFPFEEMEQASAWLGKKP